MTTTIQTDHSSESKRLKQFRLAIAKNIPKFPNDRETLAVLEAKPLGSLLIDYTNWAYRLIPPRPRKVTIEPTLTADRRWKMLAVDTKALLERASRGDDLTPYLSLRAVRNGFTPASSNTASFTDKWEDKDFFLIVMGYHHLHLSQLIEATGHAKRTDNMLFAQVTRDKINAIGFFDHSVFESTDPISQTMTAERERLWEIYDRRSSIGRKPGEVYVSNPITTSGHSLNHTSIASEFARIINSIDPRLDDLSSRSEIFSMLPHKTVKAMKLNWHLHYLDLGLIDRTTSTFHVLRYGTS
ncbi:MAG: hypothetical protein WC685_10840 [Methylobacter sp.]|jgi:hypothetical protein